MTSNDIKYPKWEQNGIQWSKKDPSQTIVFFSWPPFKVRYFGVDLQWPQISNPKINGKDMNDDLDELTLRSNK